ncbi:LysR family transcriptional regulator [Roseibacterium sp. SDUM158017]|uniref:LysR family transcriptional regulator n=1 Tax=Roseicyclus salinarum TaxID=3036773 RepID=UPI0024155D82|nr:LysR family transcriptional regulator [Roseibacterium sp. SDUM158017]MDG4648849.1 LysR family transcriptional regulator [Roseibacterium sp. SDUM158017]
MKSDLSWNDLVLFAAVARSGTLTAAAGRAGSSPATLSRRMKALEAHFARRLFLHGAQGYALTADGRALLEHAGAMERAAAAIAEWRDARGGPVRVRISAGTWTARHLARHLSEYWRPDAPFVPEFVQSNRDMDIARREIDIGIRNRRPEHVWLAGRQTGIVDYAAYAARPDIEGWIGASDDAAATRSARWVRDTHESGIVTTANDPRLMLELARAGAGRIVLPVFAGDAEQGLLRVSAPITDLRSEEWLVCHQDARHDPPIRAALEALAGFLRKAERPRPVTD